jgi:hypothetical protein
MAILEGELLIATLSHRLQRTFLPFAANEFFACLADKEQQGAEVFQYEITLSAFEIQDEVLSSSLITIQRPLDHHRLVEAFQQRSHDQCVSR